MTQQDYHKEYLGFQIDFLISEEEMGGDELKMFSQ